MAMAAASASPTLPAELGFIICKHLHVPHDTKSHAVALLGRVLDYNQGCIAFLKSVVEDDEAKFRFMSDDDEELFKRRYAEFEFVEKKILIAPLNRMIEIYTEISAHYISTTMDYLKKKRGTSTFTEIEILLRQSPVEIDFFGRREAICFLGLRNDIREDINSSLHKSLYKVYTLVFLAYSDFFPIILSNLRSVKPSRFQQSIAYYNDASVNHKFSTLNGLYNGHDAYYSEYNRVSNEHDMFFGLMHICSEHWDTHEPYRFSHCKLSPRFFNIESCIQQQNMNKNIDPQKIDTGGSKINLFLTSRHPLYSSELSICKIVVQVENINSEICLFSKDICLLDLTITGSLAQYRQKNIRPQFFRISCRTLTIKNRSLDNYKIICVEMPVKFDDILRNTAGLRSLRLINFHFNFDNILELSKLFEKEFVFEMSLFGESSRVLEHLDYIDGILTDNSFEEVVVWDSEVRQGPDVNFLNKRNNECTLKNCRAKDIKNCINTNIILKNSQTMFPKVVYVGCELNFRVSSGGGPFRDDFTINVKTIDVNGNFFFAPYRNSLGLRALGP